MSDPIFEERRVYVLGGSPSIPVVDPNDLVLCRLANGSNGGHYRFSPYDPETRDFSDGQVDYDDFDMHRAPNPDRSASFEELRQHNLLKYAY